MKDSLEIRYGGALIKEALIKEGFMESPYEGGLIKEAWLEGGREPQGSKNIQSLFSLLPAYLHALTSFP